MRTAPDPTSATWRKSSHSGGTANECVEVADDDLHGSGPAAAPVRVRVRDSKYPARGVLAFGAAAWSSFVAATAAHGR